MPQKAVGQLVADVAALAVWMVCVVMHDGRVISAGNGHRGKHGVVGR